MRPPSPTDLVLADVHSLGGRSNAGTTGRRADLSPPRAGSARPGTVPRHARRSRADRDATGDSWTRRDQVDDPFSTGPDLGDLTAGGSGWHHLDPRATDERRTSECDLLDGDGPSAPPAPSISAEELPVRDAERSTFEGSTSHAEPSWPGHVADGRRGPAGVAASEHAPPSDSHHESGIVSSDVDTPIAALTQTAIQALTGRGPAMPRPARRRTIVVANQKGGVGKTTTTVNLAAALATNDCRVLVIDLDPQGNASTALGVDHYTGVPSVYEVIIEGSPLENVIQQCDALPNLSCAPATIDLAGAEIELVSLVARESRLRKALDSYIGDVDYIFIDCPPSLGLLTINALVAAAELLIPIQCEYYALEGLGQLIKNVDLVKAHLNPHLAISTILLTMYDGRTRLASQVADEVRQHFEGVVLNTTIPRSVRISEAPSYGQTVITYDPVSTGALSYIAAAREIAANGRGAFAPPTPRSAAGKDPSVGRSDQGRAGPPPVAEDVQFTAGEGGSADRAAR